ncbi:MAG: hypothetical protein ACXV9Q_07550 [Chthoniobacterales bacterium]
MKLSRCPRVDVSLSFLRSVATLCAVICLAPGTAKAAGGDLYVVAGFRTTGDHEQVIRFPAVGMQSSFVMSSRPYAVVFDRAGNLVMSDILLHSIIKVAPDGTKTTFTTALSRPLGIAFDQSGNLFVADNLANAIYKFTPNGTRSTFASGLNMPSGLAFDHAGNLFESDGGSGIVYKFTSTGTKSMFASGISMPQGVAVDASDNIYVAEFGANVYKFTPEGTRTTLANIFTRAVGLAFGPDSNLYVSDTEGGVVAFVSPNGDVNFVGGDVQSPRFLTFEPGGGRPLNISTRMRVQSGDNALIGGFIASGSVAKKIIVRAIGPSLGNFGINGFLADPRLELHDHNGALIASNDNWKINDQTQQSQEAEITATNVAPTNDFEAALIATLQPNEGYTAIVRGAADSSGVAVVDAYDLEPGGAAKLANISTRGFVESGENVMIGGFILDSETRVIVRAIGPSLTQFGVSNALADPTLELRDGQGTLVASNDNWKTNDQTNLSQETEVHATTVPPTNDLESAIVITLPAGPYTAIVAGKNGGAGVGLVEVYSL